MSNKELAIDIINKIPECKLSYVIDMLNGLKGLLVDVEEENPDELDLKMISEAEKINDGTTMSFEELLEKDGLSYVSPSRKNRQKKEAKNGMNRSIS